MAGFGRSEGGLPSIYMYPCEDLCQRYLPEIRASGLDDLTLKGAGRYDHIYFNDMHDNKLRVRAGP